MARSEKRRRTKLFALQLSLEELEILRAAAFEARVSVPALLRDATLSAVIPPSGRHAQPARRFPESGADEQWGDELHDMSGELHGDLSEEITQEIDLDCRFVDTQDADDYAAHERLMDGVEQ